MTPLPLGFDPPGARRFVSTLQTRSPELLIDILCEHQLRGTGRYRKRDVDGKPGDETFCNLFTCDVAEAMHVLLPRGLRANPLVMWLHADGRKHDWEQVDEHTAQRMADEGQFAVACWFNQNGGPGHIAPLQPSLGEPGAWISNVGGSNFLRGRVAQAFGDRAVTFFGHP